MTQPTDEAIRAAAQSLRDALGDPNARVFGDMPGGRKIEVTSDGAIIVAVDSHGGNCRGLLGSPKVNRPRNKRIGGRLMNLKRRGKR